MKQGDLEVAFEAFRCSAQVHLTVVASTTSPHPTWMDGLAIAYEAQADVQSQLGGTANALERNGR